MNYEFKLGDLVKISRRGRQRINRKAHLHINLFRETICKIIEINLSEKKHPVTVQMPNVVIFRVPFEDLMPND